MMKRILLSIAMVVSLSGVVASMPQTASAACDSNRFLTFPTWYRGIAKNNCDIKSPNDVGGISNFIWIIALNILEIFLQIIAYASVAFIIWGGFRYMYGAGTPDTIVSSRKMILNAVVGLVIAMLAAGIVTFVVGRLQ